jgi:hypothetical protein
MHSSMTIVSIFIVFSANVDLPHQC